MPAHRASIRVLRPILAAVLAAALIAVSAPAGATDRPVPTGDAGAPADPASSRPIVPGPVATDFVPGEVLVTFATGTERTVRSLAVSRVPGARIASTMPGGRVAVVSIPASADVHVSARALAKGPTVAHAEPNWYRYLQVVPNDPDFGDLWGLHNTGQLHPIADPPPAELAGTTDADADVVEAWDTVAGGDAATVIAVVDSGIAAGHPDLDDNLWSNADEAGGTPGVDDDVNGYVDDVYGYDFLQDDATPQDANGHGSHVAGIAAAEWQNATGIAGVCPECSIMALRVGNAAGQIHIAAAIEAIRYAADNGADVINLSYAAYQWSKAERQAIQYATNQDLLVVAAAGNGVSSLDGSIDYGPRNNDVLFFTQEATFGPSYPASYDVPGLISVAASDHRDRYGAFTGCLDQGEGNCAFSNFGRDSVDLAAPGVDMLSTVPGNDYAVFNGTSMASPFVAGLAGLIRSQTPAYSPLQVKNVIMNAVDTPSSLTPKRSVTNGRVNAQTAVESPSTANATQNHDGVMSGATSITYRRSGSLAQPGDMNDIYKKRLRRGRVYAAFLRVPRRRDFDLWVWKPGTQDTFPTDYCTNTRLSCSLVTASVAGTGRDEYVQFRAKKSGVYYFHASVFKGSGNYELFVGVPA